MQNRRGACRVFVVNLRGGDLLEELGTDLRKIFEWILRKLFESAWTGLS